MSFGNYLKVVDDLPVDGLQTSCVNELCDVHPYYIYQDAQAHMHKSFLCGFAKILITHHLLPLTS